MRQRFAGAMPGRGRASLFVIALLTTLFGVPAGATPTATETDIQSAVDLAVDLATPIHGDGARPAPESFVNRGGVIRDDQELASDEYTEKRKEAIRTAEAAGNPYLPKDQRLRYAHCSQYMATVIINTVDASYPGTWTKDQYEYLLNPNNGWQKVGTSEHFDAEDYQPGDVFLTRGAGHTFMWIGEHEGLSDVVAEASYSPKESPNLRLPSLKRYSVNKETGLDSAGRAYDVWRFVGRTGEAEPPDPDDSWDYRNVFSDIDVTALNQSDPDDEPYALDPDTSALVAGFTLRTPNDAEPGDEFTLQSAEPFSFLPFQTFLIRAEDGTEMARATYVSDEAVKVTLSEAVKARPQITGTIRLTVRTASETAKALDRQALMFFGGEQELGPGTLYNIDARKTPETSVSGTARMFEGEPGLLTSVVYRFGENGDFAPADVSAVVRASVTGVGRACDADDDARYAWLGADESEPLGTGEAVVTDCSPRDNSVTLSLPDSATPPKGAIAVRMTAGWVADEAVQSYRFTATLRAPGAGENDRRSWTRTYSTAAADGVVDGSARPAVIDGEAVGRSVPDGAISPAVFALWITAGVLLAGVVFAGGYRFGSRKQKTSSSAPGE